MSEIGAPKTCGLYLQGHMPHWIQAKKGWEDEVNVPLPGRFIGFQSDGTVVIEVNDNELRLWNHSPERMANAVAASDGVIKYQERWGLLIAGGGYLFCVARSSDDHAPCPEMPPAGSPVELLKNSGGFSILVSELVKDRS